jgi:Lrp/AsnC family transcriptional regulator, leucine-responsive regulatory protein
MDNNLSKLKPIQRFINGAGKDVAHYFGKDPGCIIYLQPDGTFYGVALYEWLKKKKKNLTLTTMKDDGRELEQEKVRGRKVLIVDNDIVTGKGYKRSIEALRSLKEQLRIKDIKFAVLCDRTGLADFSVESYSAYAPWSLERIDGVDLKIIQELAQDGRKSFVDIAKKTRLSPVGIKNRVERLIDDGVLKIQGLLNIEKVYSVSAHIEIEADSKIISRLIDKCGRSPLVYHIVKTSGRYNLMVSIVAPNLESIENFIDKEIRRTEGVRHIDVQIGELPIIPKGWKPPIA